jgi:hypothetical protein
MTVAQTVFLNFNAPGQYAGNFNAWNDNAGVNGGNYSFEENSTNGVGGSGGVAVFQSADTTATYKSGSWNLASNGATMVVSLLVYADGSVTNSATVTNQTPSAAVSFFGNGTNWTINQSGLTSANIAGNVFHGTDGNGGEAVTAWYDNLVYINGFVATFTYQDVGGSVGANADGTSFDVQVSGPSYLGAGGGSLAISGLTPSADWEINLYSPNGIGITCHTDGTTFGYQTTGAVNVSSGDPINFTIQYTPGGAVQETLVDTVTAQSYTTNYNMGDITALLGSSYAYIGFSSADGGVASVQTVSNFAYQNGSNSFTLAVLTNLPAAGISPTVSTLAGQVLSSGGFAPTVTLYYGPANGGTNIGNWANSITLGVETGTFSQTISGLSPNTTYYYTASAANFAGTSWASPSLSFSTTTVTPPQVANAPATGIGASLATLNVQMLATGGVPPAVTVYYGTNDGGANAAAWSSSVSLGAQSRRIVVSGDRRIANRRHRATLLVDQCRGELCPAGTLIFGCELRAVPPTQRERPDLRRTLRHAADQSEHRQRHIGQGQFGRSRHARGCAERRVALAALGADEHQHCNAGHAAAGQEYH